MTPWNLTTYLKYAFLLVKGTTIVLWWVGSVGLLSAAALLLRDTALFWPLNIVVTILSIVSTPVIYGIYFELIEDTYSSIPNIIRTYLGGYIWLVMRMYFPPIFLVSMLVSMLPGASSGGVLEITLVLFSILYIFVIPHFYLTGTGRGAIGVGIVFLRDNLSRSTPLILAVLLLEASMLLLQHHRSGFENDGATLFILLDFLVFFTASLIDYILFIMLLFILKSDHPQDSA